MLRQKQILLISNKSLVKPNFRLETVYAFLKELENEYPGFRGWFFQKVAIDVATNKRKIISISYSGDIIATAILKKDPFEKKICTLRVHPDYQRCGLGSLLIRKSFEELQTETPLMTISASKVNQFLPLLTKYSFRLNEIKKNYYSAQLDEYVYNGTLPS